MAVQDVVKEEFLILAGVSGMLLLGQLLLSLTGSFFLNMVLYVVAVYASIYIAEVVQHDEDLGASAKLLGRIGCNVVAVALGFFAYVFAVLLLSSSGSTSNPNPSDMIASVSQSKTVIRFLSYCIYIYCADYTFLAGGRFICNIVRLIGVLIGYNDW